MNSPACAPCMHSTPQPLCSSKNRRRPSHGLCELCSCVTRLPHRPEQRQRGPLSNTSEWAGQNSGDRSAPLLACLAAEPYRYLIPAAARELTYSVVGLSLQSAVFVVSASAASTAATALRPAGFAAAARAEQVIVIRQLGHSRGLLVGQEQRAEGRRRAARQRVAPRQRKKLRRLFLLAHDHALIIALAALIALIVYASR